MSGCLSVVRGILDKLPGIKSELERGKVGWQDWGFFKLLQALKEWKEIRPAEPTRNANETSSSTPSRSPRHRSFYAHDQDPVGQCAGVNCDGVTHKSWECERMKSPAESRQILQTKRLCFNCTKPQNNVSLCRSRATCIHVKQRHHSSTCDRMSVSVQSAISNGVALTTTQGGEKVCHPVVFRECERCGLQGITRHRSNRFQCLRLPT